MFITSKNAITEAITKDLAKILYVKFPLSKREKEIIKINVLSKDINIIKYILEYDVYDFSKELEFIYDVYTENQ